MQTIYVLWSLNGYGNKGSNTTSPSWPSWLHCRNLPNFSLIGSQEAAAGKQANNINIYVWHLSEDVGSGGAEGTRAHACSHDCAYQLWPVICDQIMLRWCFWQLYLPLIRQSSVLWARHVPLSLSHLSMPLSSSPTRADNDCYFYALARNFLICALLHKIILNLIGLDKLY